MSRTAKRSIKPGRNGDWRSELRLPMPLAKQALRLAQAERRTMNQQLVVLIEKGLSK